MAIRLSATDSHLRYLNSGPLTTLDTFTVAFRATVSSWSVTAALINLLGSGASPSQGIQMGPRGTNGISLWLYGGTVLTNSGALVNGAPYQITLTLGGGAASLFVDGSLSASVAYSGSYSFDQIFVNGYNVTASETSDALLENLAIYERILTDGEIKTIASAKGYRDGIVSGLLAKYDFTQYPAGTDASVVQDLSGNGRVLSHVGTSTTLIKYAYAGADATANLRRVM